MDSFELNKIIGAILGTLLFVMGVGFLAEAIYHPAAAGPGYALPEPEGGDHGDGGGEEVAVVSIGTLLASADATQGADQAKKCGACHDLSEANANKTGPGLYDVVERVIGSHPGFAYSPVLAEHQAAGDTWTYENLNQFLTRAQGLCAGHQDDLRGRQERPGTRQHHRLPLDAVRLAQAVPAGRCCGAGRGTAASGEVPPTSSGSRRRSPMRRRHAEGIDTGASEAPGGAMTDTPAGGGETAVSSEHRPLEASRRSPPRRLVGRTRRASPAASTRIGAASTRRGSCLLEAR